MIFKGLPQGFPLLPTLYNIYALFLIPKHSAVKSIVFADDIVLYSSHADLTFAAYQIQMAINQLQLNATRLHLSISSNKSAVMVFSRRLFNTVNATLSCSTSLIPIVTKFTYLGITLDPKLL